MMLNDLARRSDVQLTLIRTSPGVHDHLLATDGIDIRNVRVRSNYDPLIIPRVARVLRETQSQILLSWLQASDVPSYFIRKLSPGTKWILTERNSYYRDEWRFRLRNYVGRRADAIVSNSIAGDAYWARLRPRGARFVIGNIVTRPSVSAPKKEDDANRLVVYAGRLEAQKNVGATLEAFIGAAASDPRLRFRIVGQGSEQASLEARARSSGFSDVIEFAGFVPDLQPHLQEADLVVSLSAYEGMPNVLTEAIVAGLPVVVSGIEQHLALVGRDYPYIVTNAHDSQSASDAILKAVYDAGASAHLAGVRAALIGRTAPFVVDEYLAMFRSIAGCD